MIGFFRFVLVMLLLTVVAMTSAILTMHFAIHGAEVQIPNLKGLTVAEAGQRAAQARLSLRVENKLYSTDVPAGRIANQSPVPGTIVRRGWRVWLTESLGPQKLAIPDALGKDQRVATIEIRQVGLQTGAVADLPQPGAQPDVVIAQSPEPGASGVAGPVVNLLVSTPESQPEAAFVMPDLEGQLFTGAALMLTKAGLHLAPLKTQPQPMPAPSPVTASTATAGAAEAGTPNGAPMPPRPLVAAGTIVAQSPAAGFRVDASTPIELTVAQ